MHSKIIPWYGSVELCPESLIQPVPAQFQLQSFPSLTGKPRASVHTVPSVELGSLAPANDAVVLDAVSLVQLPLPLVSIGDDFSSPSSSSSSSSLQIELLTSLLPRLLLIWLLPPESLLLLLLLQGVSGVVAPAVVVAAAETVVEELLLHDCIFLLRYSLIESFRFGVTVAGGSGVVNAGFSRGSELAVLVKIF